MSNFTMPVHWYMSAPVQTIHWTQSLNALHHRFIKHRISSLAVVDDEDKFVGVVSRTDLIHSALPRRETDPLAPLLTIPDQAVGDIMSPEPITVDIQAPVAEAADKMVRSTIHRVYVIDAGHLAGVLSARDVVPAVVDLQLDKPIGQFMSTPLFVVSSDENLSSVTSFLETVHVSGVVVMGKGGPVGVFTQAEAM
ncbi:MAG: CBS domain-containing protein, partial [Myxococcota bacterium]